MSNRTAIAASAAAAGLITIFSITSLAAQTASPPDSKETAAAEGQCLAAPKTTTPAGGHWYYRLEKGTKRKCWYLGDAGAKVNKPAAQTASPAADSAVVENDTPPPSKKPMQKSVANARAELTADTSIEDPSLAETTWPPLTSTTDAPIAQEGLRQENLRQESPHGEPQAAIIQPPPAPVATQGWNIASRWPEPKAVASADDTPAAREPAPTQPTPALTPDRLAAAAMTTGAATTAAPQAQPADAAQATDPSDTGTFIIRIVLALLVGVLALAAIIGPMILRYVRPRPRRERRASGQRGPISDMEITRETVRQDNPRVASPTRYADTLPEPRVLDAAVDELEDLLARASKRSAA